MEYTKLCPLCNQQFKTKSARQVYCKRPIQKICPSCGDTFLTVCHPDATLVCNRPECKKKSGMLGVKLKEKRCRVCGQVFMPESSRQLDCNRSIKKICVICGKEFEGKCSQNDLSQTCSVECTNVLASQNRQQAYMQETKICEICGKKFHPRSNTQRICDNEHTLNCIVCGKEFKLSYNVGTRLSEVRQTCSDECYHKLQSLHNGAKNPETQEKMRQTSLIRYGVNHPMQSELIKDKVFASYKQKTGHDHPSHNPLTRKGKNYKHSSLEQLVETALTNNQIRFEHEHLIEKDGISHSFDFYLPDYNILVDADGVYYHGYLDDSNGWQIDEDRDNKRLLLVPEGYMFHVIIESEKSKNIRELLDVIADKNKNQFNYVEYMFNWCRSIDFPYPTYQEDRLRRDFANLSKYAKDTYSPQVKLGMSSIRHFHKSIYDARVGSSISIKEAWYNDKLLRKVISNRMLYVNNVDPSKVLAGFYISKIVPKVSVFNPVLARYLTNKYLAEFEEVLDPFAGYSGRLLGVCSADKQYKGWDINETAILESNQLIQFHNLNGSIEYRNILQTENVIGQCLLTCPPYNKKEKYNSEIEFKTCDEWIDECLNRFSCKKYVFVVDRTAKYSEYIRETLVNKSHFSNSTEYVVVI